jgi:hypothetical protein
VRDALAGSTCITAHSICNLHFSINNFQFFCVGVLTGKKQAEACAPTFIVIGL